VVTEIQHHRPIAAGIDPLGHTTSELPSHLALIIGYDDQERTLFVNDSAPYRKFQKRAGIPDPYIAAGGTRLGPFQYEIKYTPFSDQLEWRYSVYDIVNPTNRWENSPAPDALQSNAPDPQFCPGLIKVVHAAQAYFVGLKATDDGSPSISITDR
jgi:hypothetical protein